MKNRIATLTFIFFAAIWMGSCRKDYEPGGTNAEPLTNEWWCRLWLNGQDLTGYQQYSTYTTSNMDLLWVDDMQNGYGFKIKAAYDVNALTFGTAAAGANNSYYAGTAQFPATARILDGRVFKDGGRSTTGVVTDSIYFRIIFSDAPSDTFIVAGTGRTNWAADNH